MTEQNQPKRWAEVVAKPEFQALEPMERERMRHQYFDEIVAPQTTAANYSQAWEEFNAHSQQVLGQAFGSANPASAEPETEGPGIVGNTGRRIADRASDLVGNLGIGIGKAAEAGGDFAADVTGINPGVVWGDGQGLRFTMNMPDDVNDIGDAMQSQGEAVRDYDAGYQPSFTWERLKGDLSVGNLAGYIVEQGGGSIPDMIAAVTMLPAYIATRTEEVAGERATNDGREAPGGRDYAVAAPTAVAMSVLERLGAKGILGEKEVGTAMDLLKETGRAAGKEAGTEFVQEGMEYTATTAGTETGYDPVTMLDRSAAGAVAGGGIGGIGRAATGGAEMAGIKQTEQGRQTRAAEARRAAEQADIDFEVKMRQLQESMRGDFEPNAPRIDGAQAVPEADFYAGTDGTVTAEQQTQREMPQAGPEAQQQPQGFGIQREPAAEPQPSLAPEGITFEDWDDANDAITFDESDIEPEIANIAEMAEFAGLVGVPRQAIESALSLNNEQETISALEDMVASAQAETNQPEVTPDAVDPRAESQNPEQAGQPEPALRPEPQDRQEAAGIPRAPESSRPEDEAQAPAEPATPVAAEPPQVDPVAPVAEAESTAPLETSDSNSQFEQEIRDKAAGFQGTYGDRSLAPVAQDIADHALTERRRLTGEEITALAEKHEVPESLINGLTGQPWAWDGIKGLAGVGNKQATEYLNQTTTQPELSPEDRANELAQATAFGTRALTPGEVHYVARKLGLADIQKGSRPEILQRAKEAGLVNDDDTLAVKNLTREQREKLRKAVRGLVQEQDEMTNRYAWMADAMEAEKSPPPAKTGIKLVVDNTRETQPEGKSRAEVVREKAKARKASNDSKSDPLLDEFLTPPTEPAPVTTPAATDTITAQQQAEIDYLDGMIAKRQAAIEDVEGRQYKKNSNRITMGDADVEPGDAKGPTSMNIGELNERKRTKTIKGLRDDIKGFERIQQRIRKGSTTLQDIADYYREAGGAELAKEFEAGRKQDIDTAANEAATSPTNDLPEPTEAQKEAGNYKKGHVNIQGLDVSIENPKGSTRRGTDPDGNEWSVEMKAHYGDVRGTQGADGDAVDVFIGPNPESDQVFVVDQVNADGTFDEHKALIGWDTEQEAREAYAANYDDGWKVGPVTAMSMDEFKGWLESGDTRKPLNKKEQTRAERVREKAKARAKQKEPTTAKPEVIADIGEKIGGARKDTDTKAGTGKSRRKSEVDNRPAWARRYEVSQIVELQGVPDGGRFVVHDKRSKDRFGQTRRAVQKTFATEAEAEAMLPMIEVGRNHMPLSTRDGKYEIWRKISDRKRVKVVDRQFEDRQAAMQYMAENATDIIETKTTFGEGDIPSPPDRARTGPERRQGDVKGQDFMDAFGFRGVEFGNWNNQEERQDLLNDAFDALMDLAEIIGIPSKAIGLNGDLALAFGARGQGLSGARAHYEPDRAVINLTKVNGAGSLAHEWFHALDHYFGRQDGKASSVWTSKEGGSRLKTRGVEDFASHGFRRKDSGVREEVREAYAKMIKTLFGKAETYVEETRKADEFVGRVKKELEYNLESLRNDLAEQKDPKYYKRKNQPASAEQLAEFDTIAQQFLNGQGLETEVRANPSGRSRSSMRLTNDSLEALSEIYKSVRGRSGFDGTNQRGVLDRLRATMSNYHQRLEMMANAQEGKEKVRRVPTDFAMNAKELDQGRGTDYWTTPHEMIARAFQGYIEDKVADQGNVSRFLNYGPEGAAILTPWGLGYPFPKGKERIRINESIDDFITSLKTKEEGSGVVLYSLSDKSQSKAEDSAQPVDPEADKKTTKQPAAGGIPASEAQAVADRLNDKMPGIVTVVQSVEELPPRYKFMRQAGPTNGPRGFFDPETNEVFLIADNIKDSAEAERTYLHEVVGHFGIRLAFGNELNGFLDRLYKQIPASKLRPFMVREGLKEHKAADRRVAVEEYIAYTAELNGRKPHWFKRLIARVRDWLRSVGVVKGWTNDDIYALIAQSNNPTVDTMLAQSMASLSNLRRQMDSADDNVRMAMTDDGTVTADEEADSALGMLYGFAYAGHTVYPVNPGATNADTLFRHYGYEGDIDTDAAVNVPGQYNPVTGIIGKTPNSGRGNFDFKIVDTDSALPYAVMMPAASARQGVALYQAAMDWAHNNGKKLRPDPVGLSPVNYLRRSEAMLASMMRNGTSRHLEPDYTQFAGFLDENDLVDGTEIENPALLKQFKERLWGNEGQGSAGEAVARANAHNMAAASLALTLRRKPELLKYRADSQGNIYEAAPNARTKPAKVTGPESALEWITDQITMADVANGVGARTALRAILAQSALLGPNGPRDIAGAISAITDSLALFHKGQVEKMPARALLPDTVIRRMARAYSNEGSQQQRIYYSLKDPENPRTVDDIINLKHQTPLARAVSWASKQAAGLTSQKYGALTLRQLSEISRMTLPHIKAYVATIHRMMTRRNQMAEDAVTIANDVQKWAARNAAEADTLFDLMHEATLAEVDPAEPFVSRKDMLNDRVKVLTERIKNVGGESAQSGRKKRLTDELADIKKQIKDEPRREINHNRLSPIWEKLSPAAKKHYKTMKAKYEQRHEIFMKLMEARIQNADIEQHVKRQMIAEMRYEFESNTLGGVYFPLARFGDYWVETNDENGERLFTTYESERDQKRVVKELTAANMPVTSGKFLQGSGEVDGVSLGFVQEVMETIDSSNVNEQLSSELGDAVYQLYLQALPTRSMRKNFIHRKGVQGFHRDAIRTFADNMMKGSHQLARLEYQDELSDLMVDMKKAAQKGSNTAADLYNEMVKRHEWVMNPANSTVAQKLTSIGFIWMLGITPAAALVNTTQNMVVALPVLASKFGWAAASKELVKTSGEFLGSIPGAVTDRVKGEKEGRPWSIRNALKGAEREAYDELVDLGVIDVTMAHNLAGIAETDAYRYSDTGHKVMSVVSYLFHKAEVYNRETSGIAAYRLAKASGMDHPKAVQYAADAVWDSHFDYTNTNRARFMQPNWAKVAFQFKQYSQNITYYLVRNAKRAMYDPALGMFGKNASTTKEEQREAAVQLAGTLGITLGLGGITTMPMIGVLNSLTNMLLDDDEDEPFDAETEVKQWIVDKVGQDLGERIIWGAGGAGLSSRVTLDGLWVRDPYRDMMGEDLWTHYAQQAMGPVIGGVFVSAFRGVQDISEGRPWTGVEKFLPKAFKDASKAVRYHTEGATTRQGYQLKEDWTFGELALQGLGIADHDLMKRYDANSAIRSYDIAIANRKSALLSQYYQAYSEGDDTLRKETMAAIRRFNEKNPTHKISRASIQSSIRTQVRNSRTNEAGMRMDRGLRSIKDRITYGD